MKRDVLYGLLREGAYIQGQAQHEAIGADLDAAAGHDPLRAKSGLRDKIAQHAERRAFGLGRGDDSLGDRVLRARLDRRRQTQDLASGEAVREHQIGQFRAPLGQGAGLVEGDDPRLLQRLQGFAAPELEGPSPTVPKVSLTPTRSRLGAWENYAEVGARPLMNEGRKPVAVAAMSADAGNGELDVTLTSVLITSRLKMAMLTDNKDNSSKRVRLGDVVEGSNWRLVSLEPRQAVLDGPSGQRVLPLRTFDGASGEPPTSVVATEQPAPPAGASPAPPAAQPTRSPPAPHGSARPRPRLRRSRRRRA